MRPLELDDVSKMNCLTFINKICNTFDVENTVMNVIKRTYNLDRLSTVLKLNSYSMNDYDKLPNLNHILYIIYTNRELNKDCNEEQILHMLCKYFQFIYQHDLEKYVDKDFTLNDELYIKK